jgi:NADPH:quinone reductase-like Zn-dependent oxidoreductase
MRQLQLIAHGEPSDVIELNTVSEPALGQEDVLISMEAAHDESVGLLVRPWHVWHPAGLPIFGRGGRCWPSRQDRIEG